VTHYLIADLAAQEANTRSMALLNSFIDSLKVHHELYYLSKVFEFSLVYRSCVLPCILIQDSSFSPDGYPILFYVRDTDSGYAGSSLQCYGPSYVFDFIHALSDMCVRVALCNVNSSPSRQVQIHIRISNSASARLSARQVTWVTYILAFT